MRLGREPKLRFALAVLIVAACALPVAADVPIIPATPPDLPPALAPPAKVQAGAGNLPLTTVYPGSDMSFGFTGSRQTFVAPVGGVYEFDVRGADGNAPTNRFSKVDSEAIGGHGEQIRGTQVLSFGTVLYVYVGQHGQAAHGAIASGAGGGGGGGSFVFSRDLKPFVIAGGGGGTAYAGYPGNGFAFANSLPAQDGATQGANGAGLAGANTGGGAGGAGYLANGRDGESTAFGLGASHGGQSLANGFAGGKGASYIDGFGGDGGYGGGGGGGDSALSGGGGGGGGFIGGDGGSAGVVHMSYGGLGGIGYIGGLSSFSVTFANSDTAEDGFVRIHLVSPAH